MIYVLVWILIGLLSFVQLMCGEYIITGKLRVKVSDLFFLIPFGIFGCVSLIASICFIIWMVVDEHGQKYIIDLNRNRPKTPATPNKPK